MANMQRDPAGRYPFLKSLDMEQLENLLKTDFSSSMPESASEEFVDAIVEVMLEKEKENPSGRLVDVDQAWADFQSYYNVPERDGQRLYPEFTSPAPALAQRPQRPHSGRLLRRCAIIAAAIAAFMCLLVGAQAAGLDVFGSLAQWTDDIFHFTTSSQTDAQNSKYSATLQQALEQQGLPTELAPTWFPDGFSAGEPDAVCNDLLDAVNLVFYHEDGRSFFVDVSRYYNQAVTNIPYEKDAEPVEVYTHGDKTFYIMSNVNTIHAIWSDGNLTAEISGTLTKDEIKAILNSIGGL